MKPLPRQILLGVVGPGAEWESLYEPILGRGGRKTRVIGRYRYPIGKPIPAEAAGGVTDHRTLRKFFEQPGLRGAVVLAPSWIGRFATQLALESGCSVYFASPPIEDADFVAAAAQCELETGLLLMPEFRLRFTPATLRLRELIATQLGPVESISLELSPVHRGCFDRALIELVDWCHMHWPSSIASVSVDSFTTQEPPPKTKQVQTITTATEDEVTAIQGTVPSAALPPSVHIQLQWAKSDTQGRPLTARLTLPAPPNGPSEETAPDRWPLSIRLECQQGTAILHDADHLDWSTDEQHAVESLRTERSAVEVSLDLFTRRLAGGLVPVPTFRDLARAMAIRQQLPLDGLFHRTE